MPIRPDDVCRKRWKSLVEFCFETGMKIEP
jgi:hypothetical protein